MVLLPLKTLCAVYMKVYLRGRESHLDILVWVAKFLEDNLYDLLRIEVVCVLHNNYVSMQISLIQVQLSGTTSSRIKKTNFIRRIISPKTD